MKKINEAPQKGKMLAMYTDKIEYKDYTADTLHIEEEHLLELHLYDEQKEYRALASRTRKDFIENIIDDTTVESDEIYVEEVYLLGTDPDEQQELKNRVKVINYVQYNEHDMLAIVNYRLATV